LRLGVRKVLEEKEKNKRKQDILVVRASVSS
jgi:hypothetical protein